MLEKPWRNKVGEREKARGYKKKVLWKIKGQVWHGGQRLRESPVRHKTESVGQADLFHCRSLNEGKGNTLKRYIFA